MDYEIKCYTKFSWGYVYEVNEKRRQIWAESIDDLKRKVFDKNLPWDDKKVPKTKPVRITRTYVEIEPSPASFRLPWCKSNYKRY